MQNFIMCKGLPASGKTSTAKKLAEASHGTLVRVNKDDIRRDLAASGVHSKRREAEVIRRRDEIILAALAAGLSVISDDTNFAPFHEQRFREIVDNFNANGHTIKFDVMDFTDVSVQECIRRDSLRVGTAHVGEDVILKMYNQYLRRDDVEKYIPPVSGLPNCVICDLDGTLAILNGRNPYDATNCDKDEINTVVKQTLNGLVTEMHAAVIFFSGREDKYEVPTRKFLDKCQLRGDWYLYMRKTGDNRKDAIIKKELFFDKIHGNWNPMVWIDDRMQVVNMARNELGVTVFQVAAGLF